jgi:predicted PurR-regulated permease PerM
MSDVSPHPSPYTPRALKWTICLGATALVVYLCLLILGPFLNVIAWSSVLAIAFHPVHKELVRKTVSLSAFICSALALVIIVIPILFITGVSEAARE